MKIFKPFSFAITSLMLISAHASATLLSGGLNVDNGYVAYVSTNNSVQGTQVGAGNNWGATYQFAGVNLDAGQDYYLHVYAYDQGWIAGFLGEFNLTGSDHLFANGQTNLTTNIIDWDVSTTGWGNYQDATSVGANGSWPWGYRPGVSSNADWIWSADPYNNDHAYFTTLISAAEVPEPSSLMLLGLGFVGLMATRKKLK